MKLIEKLIKSKFFLFLLNMYFGLKIMNQLNKSIDKTNYFKDNNNILYLYILLIIYIIIIYFILLK